MSAEEYAQIHIEFRDKGGNKHAARFVDKTEPNLVYVPPSPPTREPCLTPIAPSPSPRVAHMQIRPSREEVSVCLRGAGLQCLSVTRRHATRTHLS